MHLFIFGLGYSAFAIAKLALAQGFKVSATTRNPAKAQLLNAQSIIAAQSIKIYTEFPKQINDVTHIIASIPPQEQGDIVLQHFPEFPASAHLYYLSTTGVYGDYGGKLVDENSALRPNSDRLKRRVVAENLWRERGAHIFRLAGIYGPQRNVLEDAKEGAARRIYKAQQVFSRIHVDDIAQTVFAALLSPNPGSIYNVCDDEPAAAHEVVAYACELLKIAPPPLIPYEQADLSPMAREFYSANRRVCNNKIKRELAVKLHYPTYREGLAQCLQQIAAM